ncbi:hypothetical protein FACS189491_12550 [Spirochaetia bacterium]|nr:hypothetical protein FACS189491_12550 [Spirochaetia bacterium]
MGNREIRQAQVRSPSSPALAPPAQTKLSFVEFRKYQRDILDDFEQRRSLGERKFHYVSPPGSGKTLIGLELFLRLGEKALVLSPTLAVQDQ